MLLNPLISICIPSFNAEKFIKETIISWQNQSYSNFEIIIQDDCSTDSTFEIVLELTKHDNRIKLFKNQTNLGIGRNWNACYNNSIGEFIVIFNADDLIEPLFLEKALNIYNAIPIDLVSFKFTHCDILTQKQHSHEPQKELKDGVINNVFETVFFNMPFSWNFTLVKRRVFEDLKVNNSLFMETQVCDAELWYRVGLRNKRVYFCSYNSGFYIKHENNKSRESFSEEKSFIYDILPIYHKTLKSKFGKRYNLFLINKIFGILKASLRMKSIKGLKISFYLFFMFYAKIGRYILNNK